MKQTQYVMASRLELSSVHHLPRFLRASAQVNRQLARAQGRIDSRLRAQFGKLTFWTLSSWDDEAAMRAFVRTSPHVDVMRELGRRGVLRNGEFHSWETAAGEPLPAWDEVARRFERSGVR